MKDLVEIINRSRWLDIFIEAVLLVGVAFMALLFVVVLALF